MKIICFDTALPVVSKKENIEQMESLQKEQVTGKK